MQERTLGTALVLHLAAAGPAELSRCGDSGGNLAARLADLSVREASALGHYWRHFCTLRVHSHRILDCLEQVQQRVHREEALQALLDMGAPFALLSSVGHMSWRQYRQQLGPDATSSAGRPRRPDRREKALIDRTVRTIRDATRNRSDCHSGSHWAA